MKKTLSLLLALVMLLSMIPMTAFAAEAWVISDKALKEGSNTVSLDSSAEYTLYEFTADTAATYKFTAPAGVKVAYYGNFGYPQNVTVNSGESMSNTVEITYTAVGVSLLVGVQNSSVSGSSTTIKVTQGADYVEEVIPVYTYKNKAKLSQFKLPSDAVLGAYIDTLSKTNHKAVKGSDGYYHLDSASGDILLVDMDYLYKLSEPLKSDRPVMHATVVDANGNKVKYDVSTAVLEYEAVCDENGYYPLTEDLIFFYDDYARITGVYQWVLGSNYNEETAWMYACRTMKTSSSSEPSEPDEPDVPVVPDEPEVEKLDAPTIKIGNVASDGAIKVSWSKVPGAVKYEIYRASSKNGNYVLKYTTTGTSYTNTGATVGKTYYYKVKAIAANPEENSDFSNIKSRTRDLAQTKVTLSNRASDGKITVKWNAVKGATKYEVYRATSKDGTYTRVYTTKNTSYTNTSAKAGKTYYYKVRAICDVSAAKAAFSEVKSRMCDLPQPDLDITRSSGKPKLSWDKVTGAVKYKVYRATSKSGTYSLVKTTTSCSWKDTTAKKNKTYYYKVIAVCSNTSGNSAYSNIKSIKATK